MAVGRLYMKLTFQEGKNVVNVTVNDVLLFPYPLDLWQKKER